MRVSVVIPVFNEESVLPELLRRVGAVLAVLEGGPHECILVDDGSSDRTLEMIEDAARNDARYVAVALSRNFGHQVAISAGLDQSTGDVVVVMDGDLQDSPEAIPAMLAEHHAGFDVVYAQRVRRKEGPLLRASYHLFYRVLGMLADLRIPPDAGDFALMSRRVVDAIRNAPERKRYLRGLRSWVGFRQKGIQVEREARHAGVPKYTLVRLVRLALDGIFSFSTVPLRMATLLGMMALLSSTLYAGWAVYARLVLDRSPQGFTALIVAIVFLSGAQLLSLGVIGEYVGRIYEESKGRPLYVLNRVTRRT